MRVDARITSGTRQVLVVAIRNVNTSARIAILLCETEVNDEDFVALLAEAHQEIVGLKME